MLKKNKRDQPVNSGQQILEETEVDSRPKEEIEELYQAINKLSEVDRAIILLYLEEKSYREIAEILGTNTNNIGVRINRIKERIKKVINEKIN